MAIGAAAVAVLAIAIVMHRGAGSPQPPSVDQLELQQELSSADVGLLANYHVVENLDLLENYDVIEHLDELGPGTARTMKRLRKVAAIVLIATTIVCGETRRTSAQERAAGFANVDEPGSVRAASRMTRKVRRRRHCAG